MNYPKFQTSGKQPAEQFSVEKNHVREFEGKSDADIWKLFKEGSEVAFIHIYNKSFKQLFSYGSQFTVNREFIKDAIQDLFLELNAKRDKLAYTDNIRFYLMRSLKQKLIRILKKENKFDHNIADDKGCNFEFAFPMEQILIDQQIDIERREKLNLAISNLTNKQREIIFYHYYEGFDMDKIVELMNFDGKRSAQNLLYRTISILRTKLLVFITLYVSLSHCHYFNK